MAETDTENRNTGAGGTTGTESGSATGSGGTTGSEGTGAAFDAPVTADTARVTESAGEDTGAAFDSKAEPGGKKGKVKVGRLKLNRETVKNLTSAEAKGVRGGALPAAQNTRPISICGNSCAMDM